MTIESPQKIEWLLIGQETLREKIKVELNLIHIKNETDLIEIKNEQLKKTEEMIKDLNSVLLRMQHDQLRQKYNQNKLKINS